MSSMISATILTRNEEASIEACLRSLEGIADEIIVVDSLSEDRTAEICRRLGCKVSSRKFTGYGVLRQYATSLASYNYVLSIDADEVLSDDLRRSIMELKRTGLEAHRVYSVERRNYYCGTPVSRGGWQPEKVLRLFNRRYASWNMRDVGESVSFPDSLRPALLYGPLLHYRCTTQAELDITEDRHAGLKGRVLAAQNDSIAPLSPLLHGMAAYMKSYIWLRGILEGRIGRIIARRECRSEIIAYRVARHLLRKQTNR